MSLREVQYFLTRYVRDPDVRKHWQSGKKDMLITEFGLTKADKELIEQIPTDDLDQTAEGFRRDRLEKRQGEFREFLDHLGLYGPVDEFLSAFDARYTEGWQTQALELSRFRAFGIDFVTSKRLPDYLISILRFCYYYCEIAILPTMVPEHRIEKPGLTGLDVRYIVRLRE